MIGKTWSVAGMLALTGAAMLVGSASARAQSVTVTPYTMGDWAFDTRDGNGIVAADPSGGGGMVVGPATPPAGVGSANLFTGDGTAGGDYASELRNTAYNDVPLQSITTLTYSTYATQNNGSQFPYLVLEIAPHAGAAADANLRLFFEPPYQTPGSGNGSLPDQGSTALNQWQTWNALTGGWWWNSGSNTPNGGGPGAYVASLGTFEALYPDAVLENTSGGLGAVQFRVGQSDPTDQFNGYVDNFTIGVNGNNTTYDFEVPEPASMALLGTALAGLVAARRKRRG